MPDLAIPVGAFAVLFRRGPGAATGAGYFVVRERHTGGGFHSDNRRQCGKRNNRPAGWMVRVIMLGKEGITMTMKADQVAKTGRPSGYSEDVAGTICMEIMAGKSLRTICAMEGMPAASTVYAWLGQYQGFSAQYARACEVQADVLADEIIEIADSDLDPNRARVMIDARKWLAGKLRPKKYGDRVELDHKVDGNQGMQINVNVMPYQKPETSIKCEIVKPALPEAEQ